MPTHYSTLDIARILNVRPLTVARWIDKGLLKATRTVGNHRRVSPEEFRKFLATRGEPVPAEFEARATLLVVDDEPLFLKGLERVLRPYKKKLEVTYTTSGIDALIRVGRDAPNAMLIDLCLGDVDGVTLIKQIRSQPRLGGVRLMAMTAHVGDKHLAAADRAGAERLFRKPFDVKELVQSVLDGAAVAPRVANDG